jgi:hypothetical protein
MMDRNTIRIEGGTHGNTQIGAGHDVHQDQRVQGANAAALTELRTALTTLRERVDGLDGQEAERRAEAARLLAELDDEAASGRPDTGRMLAIRQWFTDHLPSLAPAVAAILQPVLTQLAAQLPPQIG